MDETSFKNTLSIVLNNYLDYHTKNTFEKMYARAAITSNLIDVIKSLVKMQDFSVILVDS